MRVPIELLGHFYLLIMLIANGELWVSGESPLKSSVETGESGTLSKLMRRLSLDKSYSHLFEMYVDSFFAPTTSFSPPASIPTHEYHLQEAKSNPMISKKGLRELYNSLSAMRVDFKRLSNDSEILEREQNLRTSSCLTENNFDVPQDLKVCKATLKLMMHEAFNKPRHHVRNKANRDRVGSLIFNKFGSLGLLVHSQPFRAQRPIIGASRLQGMGLGPSGANVIGVLPGRLWGRSSDRPLVLTAHWDAVANSPGFNDNGSGMAVLLETASILSNAGCFVNDHSIIFVATDMEEEGCHGSLEFIRKFLMPDFLDKGQDIQGAIVLDTIGNYDPRVSSQQWPERWRRVMMSDWDSGDERVGDFIAIVDRSLSLKDRLLADALSDAFDALDGVGRRARLSLSTLPATHMPSARHLFDHSDFWRSDNARFWFYTDNRAFQSLGAILVTDTAEHRGYMRECYHRSCDSASHNGLHPLHMDFVTKVAQAVVMAVANLTVLENGPEKQCNFHKISREVARQSNSPNVALNKASTTTPEAHSSDEKDTDDQIQNVHSEDAAENHPGQFNPMTTLESNPFGLPWMVKKYQPNYGGIQYNIENVNIQVTESQSTHKPIFNDLALAGPEQKTSSWLTRLREMLSSSTMLKEKQKRIMNSPMIVQIDDSD